MDVSIHAPAREATHTNGRQIGSPVFRSTPPRGKRRWLSRFVPDTEWWFQSTPPRGKRLARSVLGAMGGDVSIHAPAREATPRTPAATRLPPVGFNPRPRAGSDGYAMKPRPRPSTRFNPRPRAGSDISHIVCVCLTTGCFNPRPRAGSDLAGPPISTTTGISVSIHAPAREATSGDHPNVTRDGEVSIHAPAREATWTRGSRRSRFLMFQSTPPRGKRLAAAQSSMREPPGMFQSTPPRGKRHSPLR